MGYADRYVTKSKAVKVKDTGDSSLGKFFCRRSRFSLEFDVVLFGIKHHRPLILQPACSYIFPRLRRNAFDNDGGHF